MSDDENEHRGQLRIAYRLAEEYRNGLLYVHGLGWHFWDKKRWTADIDGVAKRCLYQTLRDTLADSLDDYELRGDVRKCETASGIAGVLDIASALPEFAASVRNLDRDPYLLNVMNGTLDLRTMKLGAHRQSDRITKCCNANYHNDRSWVDGEWDTFLHRVLPDAALRRFVQRLAGLALLGTVEQHLLPIFTGVGANGKSVLCNALSHALGDYAGAADPDLFMHRPGAHPTGEMDLLGKRLVVISETDKDRRLAEATMKRLTGGDPVKARKMRQDFVEFIPSHLPIMTTNHLPAVSGDDPAIWRRIRVVPFEVAIPRAEQDPKLTERLAAVADDVLSWAVSGYMDYAERGLNEPQSVLVATDKYQVDSDAIGRFIAEQCITTAAALKATTTMLFDAWDKWRIPEGVDALSQKAFGQALDRHGFPAGPASNGKRWRRGIAVKVEGNTAEKATGSAA